MRSLLLIAFTLLFYSITILLQAQVVSTVAGSGFSGNTNGTGTAASFSSPIGIAVDASGNLYIGDGDNQEIRKITSAGVVSTLAGSGQIGSVNGAGSFASFNVPIGLDVDAAGNVYVADQANYLVRKITPAGVVSTFAGSGQIGDANGTGIAASFYGPTGLAVDASGNVYVADKFNHLIRKITPAGVVTTLAGGLPGSANGTGAAAGFLYPTGVAVDASGNVYVADTGNNLIRKITSTGVVTTLAGSGNPGEADGTGTAASFNQPYDLAVDASGNVFVSDPFNNTIRKITAAGVVTTIAGSAQPGSANGTGTAASFFYPTGVAIDISGNLYIADTNNNLIRKITEAGTASIVALDVSEFKLYPIPASDQLTLRLTLKSESNVKLELMDISGKVTAGTQTITGNGSIELVLFIKELSGGMYIANIYVNDQMASQKVIVEK